MKKAVDHKKTARICIKKKRYSIYKLYSKEDESFYSKDIIDYR